MKFVAPQTRTIDAALHLAATLRTWVRTHREAALAASVLSDRAVILGAFQRAGRVVDLEACAHERVRVLRRATSGTAAFVAPGTLGFTLVLPRVNALAPDARIGTLLNRNVRGFLRGFATAGIPASYFGREWIAFARRPGALVGYAIEHDGVVQLDVIAAGNAPIALPSTVVTSDERSLDRWRGHAPSTVRAHTERPLDEIATCIVDAHASRWGASLEPLAVESSSDRWPEVGDANDPFPRDARHHQRACAIGFIDVAVAGATHLAGGDVLAAAHTVARIAASAGTPVPLRDDDALEGARPNDFADAFAQLEGRDAV